MNKTPTSQTMDVNQMLAPDIAQSVIYFNGFGIALGHVDIVVTLFNGPRMVGQIQANPSVLKQFIEGMTETIKKLEEITDSNYLTSEELALKFSNRNIDHE